MSITTFPLPAAVSCVLVRLRVPEPDLGVENRDGVAEGAICSEGRSKVSRMKEAKVGWLVY
ncbi:MAG: hypothetical protein ACE3JU_11575 [Paenibacillus sp.]|uniref:hypothetical protein n=1 Tax=Paenibacillus sp. TaxID=58172 RepID=UPI003B770246